MVNLGGKNSMKLWGSSSIRHALLAAAAVGCFSSSFFYAPDADAMSLQETLEKAYEFNPEVKSERENLGATDERVSQAVSEFRPNASIDYSRGRQKLSFGGAPDEYSDKETQ